MHNQKLRQARQQKRWSIEKAAEQVGVSWLTFSRWEHGTQQPRPTTLALLCEAFHLSPEELGYAPEDRSLGADTESSEAMKRREALQKIAGTTGTVLLLSADLLGLSSLASDTQMPFFTSSISQETILGLAAITQQHRHLQRSGTTILLEGLQGHLATIQNALESTLNEQMRRELWRVLAQAQLLARLHVTKGHGLGRAKTWNEAAIASAQHSGDPLLVGAALGHLAHWYLTTEHNVPVATQLLESARAFATGHPVLNGWFHLLTASIAAKEGNVQQCQAALAQATEMAAGLAPEDTDAFFTDFTSVGVDAFAGNCFLAIHEPKAASERLTGMPLSALSTNRQASALYDLSRAYAEMGELEAAQTYALQSIEKALATRRLYLVPRFIQLTQDLRSLDPHAAQIAAIEEYTRIALNYS